MHRKPCCCRNYNKEKKRKQRKKKINYRECRKWKEINHFDILAKNEPEISEKLCSFIENHMNRKLEHLTKNGDKITHQIHQKYYLHLVIKTKNAHGFRILSEHAFKNYVFQDYDNWCDLICESIKLKSYEITIFLLKRRLKYEHDVYYNFNGFKAYLMFKSIKMKDIKLFLILLNFFSERLVWPSVHAYSRIKKFNIYFAMRILKITKEKKKRFNISAGHTFYCRNIDFIMCLIEEGYVCKDDLLSEGLNYILNHPRGNGRRNLNCAVKIISKVIVCGGDVSKKLKLNSHNDTFSSILESSISFKELSDVVLKLDKNKENLKYIEAFTNIKQETIVNKRLPFLKWKVKNSVNGETFYDNLLNMESHIFANVIKYLVGN